MPEPGSARPRGLLVPHTVASNFMLAGLFVLALGRAFEHRGLALVGVEVGRVAMEHWREEGVSSPEEFIEVWRGIHPRAPGLFTICQQMVVDKLLTVNSRPVGQAAGGGLAEKGVG